jgi:hypothetical protein
MWRVLITIGSVAVLNALFFLLFIGTSFESSCAVMTRWVTASEHPTSENLHAFQDVWFRTSGAEARDHLVFGGLMLIVTAAGFFIVGGQCARRKYEATRRT